jgi:hypothetical protein
VIKLYDNKIVLRANSINVWKLETIFNLIQHEIFSMMPTGMEFITQLNKISSKESIYKLDKYNLSIYIIIPAYTFFEDMQTEWDSNDESEIDIDNDHAFKQIKKYLIVFFEKFNCNVCRNLLLENFNILSMKK